jgi:hypothetical protein
LLLATTNQDNNNNMMMTLPQFAQSLEYLRNNCFDIIRFIRISGQGKEKIVWIESTAVQDERRLSLEAVKNTFGRIAKSNQEEASTSPCKKQQDNNESKSNNNNNVEDKNDNDFIQEMVETLRRDVRQEKEARIAEEEKNKILKSQLFDLLRLISKTKIVKKK